ncbi:TetR/AcrR family transcriptional regulator C-terminal domain-containing protein [Anaerotignum sp.]
MNRTKEAISEAFWQLLVEKTYGKITVHDVVERCQVNRNTFYYHFRDIPDLVEYTIDKWLDEVIKDHCEFISPISCLTYMAEECAKRKNAILHLYRSTKREAFMEYLSKMGIHIMRSYVDSVAKTIEISPEDQEIFIRFYKCTFVGIILDWLDEGASYDLFVFCEKIYELFWNFEENSLFPQGKKKN